MTTIPYVKDLKTRRENNALRDRIGKAIVEADDNWQEFCSLSIDKELPKEISDELHKKGYRTETYGLGKILTLYIYWNNR